MSERYQLRQGKLRPHPTGEWVRHADAANLVDDLLAACEAADAMLASAEGDDGNHLYIPVETATEVSDQIEAAIAKAKPKETPCPKDL